MEQKNKNLINKNIKPKKPKVEVTPLVANDDFIGKTCSICGTGIISGESIAVCPCCSLPYHYECWEENGGCGSYGCKAAPEVEKIAPVITGNYNSNWQTEKVCPECGLIIPAKALRCRVCNAEFPTEKPMTKTEWLNREYSEKELLSIRTSIIIQFIVSTICYLSFIMFFYNLNALNGGSSKYEYKRLTPELKLLVKASVIISTFWGFILSIFILRFGGY